MLRFCIHFLRSNRLLLLLTLAVTLFNRLENQHVIYFNAFTRIPMEQLYDEAQLQNCYKLQQLQLVPDAEFGIHNTLNYLLYKNTRSKRTTQILRSQNDGTKIIAKTSTKSVNSFKSLTFPLSKEILKREFFAQSPNLDFQFCPQKNIHNFIDYFSAQSGFNETTIWLLILTNIELLLQPYLYNHNFPVPKTYGACDLTTYQEYVGYTTLQYFENENFAIKVRIAKQLLDAALIFTEGIAGQYRIYITDLTSDNLIYNATSDKLYFIDLDMIYIVDGENTPERELIDYHEYIKCDDDDDDDCFAFVPDRLCMRGLSDLNILATCLYLRGHTQNVAKKKGFLNPIPESVLNKYSNLPQLLDDCVGAEGGEEKVYNDNTSNFESKSRFKAASKLNELFREILEEVEYGS